MNTPSTAGLPLWEQLRHDARCCTVDDKQYLARLLYRAAEAVAAAEAVITAFEALGNAQGVLAIHQATATCERAMVNLKAELRCHA